MRELRNLCSADGVNRPVWHEAPQSFGLHKPFHAAFARDNTDDKRPVCTVHVWPWITFTPLRHLSCKKINRSHTNTHHTPDNDTHDKNNTPHPHEHLPQNAHEKRVQHVKHDTQRAGC